MVGPFVLNVLTPEMNTQLAIISDVALGFIAYSIGSEFKLSYLKEIGVKPMLITLFEGCTASVAVFRDTGAAGSADAALPGAGRDCRRHRARRDADGRPAVQGQRPRD